MMRFFGISLLMIATFVLSACGGGNGNEWRQKLTVTVEIDGKEYVGSGVSKMRSKGAGRIAYESRGVAVDEDFEGEAVVIDLGPHGYLFALWKYQDPGYWARSMRGGPRYQGDYEQADKQREEYYKGVGSSKGVKILTPGKIPDYETDYPTFVAFKNINNPKSIQTFAKKFHWEKRDRTARVFDPVAFARFYSGTGAKVKSVTFEITDEPVTDGLLFKVIGLNYFETWRKEVKKYKHPADCIDRTNNRPFCAQHKGMWVRKFPGESR